jgi:hypothetical protein
MLSPIILFAPQDLWLLFYYLWASKGFFSFTLNTFKATKIVQIGFEMNKICFFEMKGVIVWFRQKKTKLNFGVQVLW